MRGGAGRTRTNHQSVMEHGWCPTSSPGRTAMQIAGRFAVLLDFPDFLYSINYRSVMEHGWCPPTTLGQIVGRFVVRLFWHWCPTRWAGRTRREYTVTFLSLRSSCAR